jgi:FAD/FMN-containing dehydrogenase
MTEYNKITDAEVKKLESICGEEYVTDSEPLRYSYMAKGIMGLEAELPEVIVRPANVEEVTGVLQVANDNLSPVTPAAGGLSGGFALPAIEPGGILMDMARMNRMEVDPENRVMVVEPGVKCGDAWRIFKKKWPEWAPPIPDGAPPGATILGDAIERGFSLVTARYGPQADMIMGLEVVLPDGQIFKTGSWALDGAKAFYRWGIGPNPDGLFLGSQGSMGIVTKAAVKIVPHPHHKTIVAYGGDSWDHIVEPVWEIAKHEMGISDNTVMVQGGNWPLVMTRWPKGNIPQDYKFYDKIGIDEYWMNTEIWAHSEEELNFTLERIDEIYKDYELRENTKCPKQDLHPKQIASRLKKPNLIAVPYGLYQAGFLFITWYTPWLEAPRMMEEYCAKMEEYGFPPTMWVASIDHARQAIVMPILCFDSTEEGIYDKIRQFNLETTKSFLKQGWINYRPDPFVHAPETFSKSKEYYKMLVKFRKVLDPNMILHPGRLAIPWGTVTDLPNPLEE